MKMFCFQCQETAKGVGCQAGAGVCGKTSETANLQDLLIYVIKGISYYQIIAHDNNMADSSVDDFVVNCLFKTITNANFDDLVFYKEIEEGLKLKKNIAERLKSAGKNLENHPE